MTLNILLKSNLRNKLILSLVSFASVIFCLVYFLIIPTVRDIETLDKEIEDKMTTVEEKYQRSHNLKQSSDNLKKIEPNLNLMDKIFISENRELDFITTLENRASEGQITQKINLIPPKIEENSKYQKGGLELTAKGKFGKLLDYLANLESLSYYINVKSLELTPIEGKKSDITENPDSPVPDDQTLNLSITANTFWE